MRAHRTGAEWNPAFLTDSVTRSARSWEMYAGAGAIAPQGVQNDEAPAEQWLRRNDMKTHRHRMIIIFWKAVSPFLYLSSLVTGST